MFCRCRYLQVCHPEYFRPITSLSVLTRRASGAAHPPFPPRDDGKVTHDQDGNILHNDLGSARSPLAFKPFPSPPVRNTPSREWEASLGLDSEEELSSPVILHIKDPLLSYRRSVPSPRSSTTTEDAKDVKVSGISDSEARTPHAQIPWDKYVIKLKTRKRRRQLAKADIFRDPADAIREWDRVRTWDRPHIANLSVLQWTLLAQAGCLLSHPSVLYNLPAELVDAHENSPRAQASMAGRVLRRLVPFHPGFAKHSMFDPLLQPWESYPIAISEEGVAFDKNVDQLSIELFSEYYQDKPAFVDKLPRDMIFRLVAVAAYRCPEALSHGGLLNAFFAASRQDGPKLVLTFPSHDPEPFDNAPTGHVWALFRLVQVYINSESPREAFRLFQRLVQEKMITPSAISQVNINREDPRTAILYAITKTCLDYEWNTGALELMILAAERDSTIFDEQMKSVVTETLHTLLKQAASMSPAHRYGVQLSTAVRRISRQEAPYGPKFLLQRIVTLVKKLKRDHKPLEIEEAVIQDLYTVARRLDSHQVAEGLFSIGRVYMPPSKPMPSLLVSPSFAISGNVLSRQLLPVEAHHTIYKSIPQPMPPYNDHQATVSSSGDSPEPSTSTKSRYPPPNGSSLLWLFEAMLKKSRNVHLCRQLAQEVVDSNIEVPIYDRGRFIRLMANAGFARAVKEIWRRYSRDGNQGVIGHAGAMTRVVSLFHHLGKDAEAKEAMVNEGLEDFESFSDLPLDSGESLGGDSDVEMRGLDDEDAKVLFDADAAKAFAMEVVEKFRACKEPIKTASQHDLNALALTYFMVDKPEEGFELFQMVKGTRPPDMYDVNVGLLGVAKYNVGLASRMVDRMYERGLVADAVTWGTLIHLAYVKGDVGLTINLVKRALERGVSVFSSRTIASLIRASLLDVAAGSPVPAYTIPLGVKATVGSLQLTLGGEGNGEQIKQNLVMASHLIGMLDTRSFVGTWSLAKFCVERALWLGDAKLAFRFWSKYLGLKTQWNDPEQVKIRKRLWELIVTGKEERKLEAPQATEMLRKLGHRDVVLYES